MHRCRGNEEESGIPVYEDISKTEVCKENFEIDKNIAYGPVRGTAN